MTQGVDIQHQQSIDDFSEKAYLDYAQAVILERALPRVGDGLKPVQRRILYAMSQLGLKHQSKHKKSARTVGDVLGKYHPHGDQACYEAMVLMAQPFAYRYPFIDGQGNWGSLDDPKSFAAMRYTEAKLTAYAQVLLSELNQGAVDWQPNFDGTFQEPVLMPARLPNILLNGSSGIAVGMACDVPPHHLGEVVDACIELIDRPESTVSDLMQHIQGPDFPSGGTLVVENDLAEVYETGKGSLLVRANYHQNKDEIIIDAIPYQTATSKILMQIGHEIISKKLPMVTDIRDESDHEHPIRIVLVLRSSRVNGDDVMAHLFATTDCQKNVRVNLNIIGNNHKPAVRSLKTMLSEWITCRKNTVRKRLQHRADQINERLHILHGLLLIYEHIDTIIAIIREHDDAKKELRERYQLSEEQAEAILNIRLRQLAKIEYVELQSEQKALEEEAATLHKILSDEKHLNQYIKEELLADKAQFSDQRRTTISRDAQALKAKRHEVVIAEQVTIILSKLHWIKSAKGHTLPEKLHFKTGDELKLTCSGNTKETLVAVDSQGKLYNLKATQLPSVRTQGDPASKHIDLPAEATLEGLYFIKDDHALILTNQQGRGMKVRAKHLVVKTRQGKQCFDGADAGLVPPCLAHEQDTPFVVLCSSAGRMGIIALEDVPTLSKGLGNKLMALQDGELLSHCATITAETHLTIHAGKRHMTLKPEEWAAYRIQRARRGKLLPRGFQRISHTST